MTRNRFVGRSAAVLLALAGLVGLAGCDPRQTGNGEYGEKAVHVADFTGVRVQDGIAAVITVAPELPQTVTLTGDENIVENNLKYALEADVVGTTAVTVLHVWASPSFVPVIPPRVVINRAGLALAAARSGSLVQIQRPSGSAAVGGPLAVDLASATLGARDYPVERAAVDLEAGSTAVLHSDGPVTGTVSADSHLDNTAGAGPCLVPSTGNVACNG